LPFAGKILVVEAVMFDERIAAADAPIGNE
jgi:hypothetical protein